MLKKIALFFLVGVISISLCGCVILAAGAAAGGTAYWLSGKLTQDVNIPFDRCIQAARSGLDSLKMTVTKETVTADSAQVMSKYTDNRTVWIDIQRMTEASSRIAVRVGAKSDKETAQKIMSAIKRYL